jgi:hypothetical protein
MPPCKPAPQCKLILPATGKRCGSLALRGQPFCYHHTGKQREYCRERMLNHRLDRLGEQLNAMGAAQLLNFLQQKLAPFVKTFVRNPEVGYTLVYTLDRLAEITTLESILRQFLQQNQEFAARAQAISNTSRNMQANHAESII